MRVAIDEQIFLLQRRGGVSRYFAELIRAFDAPHGADPASDLGVDAVLPFQRVWNEHALEMAASRGLRAIPANLAPYPELARAFLRRRRAPGGVDLVHHTFYAARFLRDYPARPKVVTIYDMIPEIMGERGRFGNPHMAKRRYVEQADMLLYISDSARQDLISVYGDPRAPYAVTHLGVDAAFFQPGPRPVGFPEQYVLYVGRRGGYKDFATMLAAFEPLAHDDHGLELVCVGGGAFTADEMGALPAGLGDRIHQFGLPDKDMPGAYAHAQAFVFPSRYEGFGLPVLEAMAAGTPAVLARTSSLPEVGGSAALYFEPGDAQALAGALNGLLTDDQGRARLVAAGRARAKTFTWGRTASQTAAAYRRVLGSAG